MAVAWFGMGCFWGWNACSGNRLGSLHRRRLSGRVTQNPTYKEVCSGLTGHAETVQVVFDPKVISYGDLLKLFWEQHDPAQGMRQGGDIGTQYRSVIFFGTTPRRRSPSRAWPPISRR